MGRSWATCPECHQADMTHATEAELEAEPLGAWRREWRGGGLAMRWFTHPCDDPQKPWKLFGPWGVDELAHVDMQESSHISTEEAFGEIARTAARADCSADNGGGVMADSHSLPDALIDDDAISPLAKLVYWFLCRRDGSTLVSAIAQALRMDGGNPWLVIDELSRAGWVSVRRQPSDLSTRFVVHREPIHGVSIFTPGQTASQPPELRLTEDPSVKLERELRTLLPVVLALAHREGRSRAATVEHLVRVAMTCARPLLEAEGSDQPKPPSEPTTGDHAVD